MSEYDNSTELEENVEEVETNEEPYDESMDESEDNGDDPSREDENNNSESIRTVTQEEIDSLSDEDFDEFMNSGKLPNKPNKNKAKVISKPESKSTSSKEQREVVEQPTADNNDYKAVCETIFKPFKANGKTITPRSVQDVISLMQQGANYTKKMQAIAPMRKSFESLKRANINEQDLNFLIDLHKGNKEAIKKLLSKNNVDPMDLDLDTAEYVDNNNNIATDTDTEFSDLLEDMDTNSAVKINDIINKQWDRKSREAILTNPQLMKALSEEIELGRFDQVQSILDNERAFGRYKGVSDIEAYSDIITTIVNNQLQEQQRYYQQLQLQQQQARYKPNNKSKAAPTRAKAKPSNSSVTAKDIFSMSDKDFENLSLY